MNSFSINFDSKDLDFTSASNESPGTLTMISALDVVSQRLKTALTLWKGEWFFDWDAGVNYLDPLNDRIQTELSILAEIKRVLTRDEEVSDILSLESKMSADSESKRELIISFEVSTPYGTISEEL
jgi:hypothetical protein